MSARFGLLGEVLGYSMSPAIHRQIFEAYHLDASYTLIELNKEEFSSEAGLLRLKVFDGFNVTTPYKEMIMKHLDEIDPFAESIGAVNTVLKKEDKWIGYNTDYFGFVATLSEIEKRMGKMRSAMIMGSGGAAKVVITGLKASGFERIIIVSRKPYEAKLKFPDLTCITYADVVEDVDLLINATPYGQKIVDTDHDAYEKLFERTRFFYDLNYNPPKTLLMEMAEATGVASINGLEMLAIQAVKAEEIWWDKALNNEAIINQIIKRIKSR